MADQPGDGDPLDILSVVEEHFDHAIGVLREVTRDLRAGEDVPPAEVKKAGQGLLNAMQSLLEFKARLQNERERQQGLVPGISLDLDEARDKVGSLLDRLRAYQRPRAVSE